MDRKNGSGVADYIEDDPDGDYTDRPCTTSDAPSTSRAERFFKLITNPMRKAVSQNRRRMTNEDQNLNLDLTYITDRIIALGYPAEDFEMLYRNTMTDTQRFLNGQHQGKYMVFNLRGRFSYKPERFENRVISFEMMDHHPPKLEYMAQFCREAHEYLEKDKRNVIAVHCKAGKGRTGVMICAYLVYIGFYPKPRSIMDYYSIIRTTNNKGVTIPSQRRYIYYFHHLRQKQLNYLPLRVELVGVYIECPKETGTKEISLRVMLGDAIVFQGAKMKPHSSWGNEYAYWKNTRRDDCESIDFSTEYWREETIPGRKDKKRNVVSRRAYGWTVPQDRRVFIEGDVRVDIYHDSTLALNIAREKLGHIWFNTMFVCPGYCQTHYIHGDEEDPYPEGLTSISELKADCPQQRPKTGSASEPPTRPGSPKLRGKGGSMTIRSARSPSFDARKSARFHLNSVVRKLTESARSCEPDGEQASTSRETRKKSKDGEKKSSSWSDTFQIVDPPALETHCPKSSLPLLYPAGTRSKREAIKEMLISAHERALVRDGYHELRNKLNEKGPSTEPVKAAESTDRPFASGPAIIRRNANEHVQCFPVYEIDRAMKKKSLPEECKIFIVTKCIDPTSQEDRIQAAHYIKLTDDAQKVRDKKKAEKLRKNQPEENFLQNITYTKYCEPGSVEGDIRASDENLKRFFTKQRDNSPSRYPPMNFRCPLYPVDPSETISPSESSYNSSVNDVVDPEVRQKLEAYHPEYDVTTGEQRRCETSGSSTSSSTSSEEVNGVNGL